MIRFRLLQARLPGDRVAGEERAAFASRLDVPVEQVLPFDLLAGDASVERVTEGVDAVLVGGSGAFSVLDDAAWLPPFFDTLGGLAEAGFPTFASCFGFQGLVVALGGEVARVEDRSEVGSFELAPTEAAAADPIFGALPERFVAQQGHKDSASTLPSGVVNLVRSERCAFQAIRIGEAPVWATQFHPELRGVDNRLRFERYLEMYREVFGRSQASAMLDAFREGPEANALLRRFRDFLELRESTPGGPPRPAP